MTSEKRFQIKFFSDRRWYNPNYLLIAVLFLLPTVLFIAGIILFIKSSPSAFHETKQNVSTSASLKHISLAPSEAHKLIEEAPEKIKPPSDLRKQAGSLFNYVFDDGVFFKPANAFASREFFMDRKSQTVVLRLDYDVSPVNSTSGVFFKTQGLDLSKVKHMSFSAKSDEGKSLPVRFRVEFKDQISTVRRFSVTQMAYDWRLYDFDFNINESINISEIVFVFENAKVGPLVTAGTVDLKDLKIE